MFSLLLHLFGRLMTKQYALHLYTKNNYLSVRTISDREVILEAMKKAGEPLNAGKVAELTGLDRKIVDKEFASMKKDGIIVSPIRCKWEPANK